MAGSQDGQRKSKENTKTEETEGITKPKLPQKMTLPVDYYCHFYAIGIRSQQGRISIHKYLNILLSNDTRGLKGDCIVSFPFVIMHLFDPRNW